MRVAPVQTLRRMRELDPQARHAILAQLRAPLAPDVHTLGATNRLRVYLDAFSIKQGDAIHAHVAYDGPFTDSYAPFWRIVQVHAMENADEPVQTRPSSYSQRVPAPNTPPSQLANQHVDAPPYDREAVGYMWPESLVYGDTEFWPPGLYALEVDKTPDFNSAAGKDYATAYFIVRPRAPQSYILLCWPFMTLGIYAGLGDQYESTYNWGISRRQRRVSLDRPLDTWPAANKLDWCVRFPLLMWNFIMSEMKKPVDPCTSFDLHHEPGVLDAYQLFLSVGHDEYWSKEMRDHVEAFVAQGGNSAFFGGNACWSQVRVEGRTLVCYKSSVEDPIGTTNPAAVTGLWSAPPTNRPENSLTGVSTRRGGHLGVSWRAQFVVVASDPMLGDLSVHDRIPQFTTDNFRPERPNKTRGQWLLDSESDGVDFTVTRTMQTYPAGVLALGVDVPALQDGDVLQPTGLDGTPTNFKILAVADLTRADQPGWPTIGYFTNVGTVFTASTVNWANYLDVADSGVADITRAVINRLYAPIKDQPPASFLKRERPPIWVGSGPAEEGDTWRQATTGFYPWARLETGLQAGAIAAGIQGELFLMTPDGSVVRRDMENPTFGQWQPTAMKVPLSGATVRRWAKPVGPWAMACSLHGRVLHCRARSNLGKFDTTQIHSFLLPQALSTPYRTRTVPNGDCIGLGSTDAAWFAAVDDGVDRWLTYDAWFAGTARPVVDPPDPNEGDRIPEITTIGRWLHTALAGGGYDGKLYAVNRLGEIVVRDGTLGDKTQVAVDLVWSTLGHAPEGTFALAACAGRLFALTGTPDNASLWWRVAAPDMSCREPTVVFLRDKKSWGEPVGARALTGILSESGDLALTGEVDVPAFDLAVQTSPTDILFYDSTGSAALYRFDSRGFRTTVTRRATWARTFSSDWTIITYVRNGRVLFYNGNTGRAVVGRFVDTVEGVYAYKGYGQHTLPSPFFLQEWSDDIGNDWTHIAASHDGMDGSYIMLYDANRGNYGIGAVAADGTYRKILAIASGLSTGWDTLVAAGQTGILLYNAHSSGDASLGDNALVEWAHGRLVTAWDSISSPTIRRWLASFIGGAGNGLLIRLSDNPALQRSVASFGVKAGYRGVVDLRDNFGPRIDVECGNDPDYWPQGWRQVVALGGK